LPDKLRPNALASISQDQALAAIQSNFGIKLPVVDLKGSNKSVGYHFVYAQSKYGLSAWEDPAGAGGYTPWFDQNDWGKVYIFQLTFEYFDYNAYDIAGVMVHEATHAWQQYSIAERVETDNTF